MSSTTRRFALGFLLVALLIAGVVSYWASSSPDGLNKVASDTGFDAQQEDHALDESPFAGYSTKGLGDGFASGAAAGVAGVAITLALAGGLTLVLRRRAAGASDPSGGRRTDVDGSSADRSATDAGPRER
jgi:hypothetical protein